MELLAEGMDPLGIFTPLPWIFPILHSIPGLGKGMKEFAKFSDAQVVARRKVREGWSQRCTVLIIVTERASTAGCHELVDRCREARPRSCSQ